eukprot:snap_masked-scaffold_113-processed-gene-0.8-mRNA-1 protein AED:1.00 eAED:1.00 QI:0/0/0/0/1/1/3/0/116
MCRVTISQEAKKNIFFLFHGLTRTPVNNQVYTLKFGLAHAFRNGPHESALSLPTIPSMKMRMGLNPFPYHELRYVKGLQKLCIRGYERDNDSIKSLKFDTELELFQIDTIKKETVH